MGLWRHFGNSLFRERRSRYKIECLSMAQTYVGAGRLLEAVAIIQNSPRVELLT